MDGAYAARFEPIKTAVVGEYRRRPLKETAGPSINTMITVMSFPTCLADIAQISCSILVLRVYSGSYEDIPVHTSPSPGW
jgi:hypothetical protein